MIENKVDSSEISEAQIYEGGSLSKINVSDLKGNDVAIRQLINNYNSKIQEYKNKELEVEEYKGIIEYLKTSPFIAIISAISSLIGAILIGIGGSLISQSQPPNYTVYLIILGGLLNILGSLSNIFYPSAKKWFNKK